MCGIFGILLRDGHEISKKKIKFLLKDLFKLSESRGKESSGLAIIKKTEISVTKSNLPAKEMLSLKETKNFFKEHLMDSNNLGSISIIGHTRLVTDGNAEIHSNNQPIITEQNVGIHNGIIVNHNVLWHEHLYIKREFQVDTEILFKMINNSNSSNQSLEESIINAFNKIEGTASIGLAFTEYDYLLLATNNGSLYYIMDEEEKYIIFASEAFILQLIKKKYNNLFFSGLIKNLHPGNAKLFHLYKKKVIDIAFDTSDHEFVAIPSSEKKRSIKDHSIIHTQNNQNSDIENINDDISLLKRHEDEIKKIYRCKKCVLPYTFPFIEFDEEGICNYCNNYKNQVHFGETDLQREMEKFRSKNGKPDCLIMFSGGRDSSYMVHYVKKVLKMNPITYTYDWGMVTDLARRNIARICGKLKIENILVSADIRKKRRNIKMNILAWLKKPELGMVPLFMAGDKQWYYYANKVKKQLGIELVFLGTNRLEETHFKQGFCGIYPNFSLKKNYLNIFKLLFNYFKNYIKNPSYINKTLIDNLFAIKSLYFSERNYIYLYSYIHWNEKKIETILDKSYNWETATDTNTTWRIGDGTAPFYNYIYHTVAGFTESDTFSSNQIREGLISREEALKIIEEENKPRYESIKWYLNIIGLGNKFNEIITKINSIPKLWKNE